jgi:hypothetical protein
MELSVRNGKIRPPDGAYTQHFTKQVGLSDNNCDLNSGDVPFESRPRRKLSWLRIVYGFPQSFQANSAIP